MPGSVTFLLFTDIHPCFPMDDLEMYTLQHSALPPSSASPPPLPPLPPPFPSSFFESGFPFIPPTFPFSHAVSPLPAAPSLAALRARFSRMVCFRSSSTAACRSSTPWSQYPKLAPTPAKTGYAHSEPRLNQGRISRPSCQKRTATPVVVVSS